MNVWYSYMGLPYQGTCPPYYDLAGHLWYDTLCSQLAQIEKTVINVLNEPGAKKENYFNTDIVEGANWETISLMSWNKPSEIFSKKGWGGEAKKLFDFFKDIPGLLSISISILQPKTHIKPHYGDTDAVYRLHIPIVIPAELPDCGFKVAGADRAWKKNEAIVFCDAHLHEAWNDTDKVRVILIVDVLKKELLPFKNKICYNVLSLLELQKLYLKNKRISNAPGIVKGIIRKLLFYKIMMGGND